MLPVIPRFNFCVQFCAFGILAFSIALSGCTASAQTAQSNSDKIIAQNQVVNAPKTSIAVTENSNTPAAVILAFYKALAEKRFRDMFMMTNMKGAVEGLSEAEMEDLRPDFETLIDQVKDIEITGEQLAGNLASVMVKSYDPKIARPKVDILNLRNDGGTWTLILDVQVEEAVKQQGKNYFFNLRIDTHHEEVESILQKFMQIEMVYAIQNGGEAGNLDALSQANLIDPQSLNSIGYKFNLEVSKDKKKYTITAEPNQYGRSGKLSYRLEGAINGSPKLKSEDRKGQPIR